MKELNKLTAVILSTILVLSTGTVNAFAFDGEQDIKFADSVSINNPVYHEGEWNGEYHTLSVPDYTDWTYVYFGSYPQSEVTDAAIINQIDEKLSAQNLTVGDVWIGNIKYRKIEPENADKTIKWIDKDNNNRPDQAYRYFKWERIKWKVLNIDKATNKLFLWSDMALDCNVYDEKAQKTTWETSTLRSFLNSGDGYNCKKSIDYGAMSKDKGFSSLDFYSTAFSQEEHKMIQRSLSAKNGNPNYPLISGGNDADDLVFLLSYDEITNPKYGFAGAEHEWLQSNSRKVAVTDYAEAMGVGKKSDEQYGWDSKSNCIYWLRNIGIEGTAMASTFSSIDSKNGITICGHSDSGYGVVPAINIILSSDISAITKNDGTSGSGGSILSKEEVQQKAAEEAKKEEEKQEKATLSLSLTGKITKLKKDSVTVKFTNKTSSSVSIKTNDSKFKKKKTIKIKPGKSKSAKLKLKSKKLKKKKLKLKFKCSYAGKTYKITVNSKKVTVK